MTPLYLHWVVLSNLRLIDFGLMNKKGARHPFFIYYIMTLKYLTPYIA